MKREDGRMQILLGTTNPSKAGLFQRLLAGTDVSFVMLRDLGVTAEPEECGATPEENARIKAAFYHRYAPQSAVICADSGLYLDALPLDDPRQPGLHVRTPGGCARLDDEAMIRHYAALSHALGGRVLAYYLDGVAVWIDGTLHSLQATREEAREDGFWMTDTPCAARRPGWPLDSLSLDLNGTHFLSQERRRQAQQDTGSTKRLCAFLRSALGLEG